METITIKGLDDPKILKQIIIISDKNGFEIELGSIFYTRPFSQDYNLIKQSQENEKESDPINRLLQEYPKQKNYPEDEIDLIISDSVRKAYPKSIVRNDTILFSIDLEKLKVLKTRNVIKSSMYFSPEFSKVSNFYDYVGKEFKAPAVNINIYSYYKSEFLKEEPFFANYDATNPNTLEKLSIVTFE